MSIKYVQSNTLYLAGSGVIVGATSAVLTTLTDIYANVLAMTDFGATGFITFDPDTTNEEGATFTGITANANGTYTLTGLSTILAKSPYTATSGLVRAHAGGTKVVITDNVAFWNTFANKQNDETIAGRWGSATVPSASNDYVNKAYADALAIAGSPNASTTVKGIGEVSVAPVSSTTPIFVGDNDPRVPTQGENDALVGDNTDIAVGTGNKFVTQTGLQHGAEFYAADSGAADIMVVTLSPIPTSYTAGMVVKTKAGHANATTTPTINVNSLGAKTIVKNGSSALVAGDIATGQLITLMYDGTNFQLQNPPALTPPLILVYKNGIDTSRTMASGSGTQNIAHGLGVIPKNVTIFTSNTGGSFSYGSYNGTSASFGGLTASSSVSAINSFAATTIQLAESGASPRTQSAVVTFDATNIILTWTAGGTNGTDGINTVWQANS